MNSGGFDSFGIQGHIFHYSMIIAMVGSAFIVFLYLWYKGRLCMDEEAKFEMMREDDRI